MAQPELPTKPIKFIKEMSYKESKKEEGKCCGQQELTMMAIGKMITLVVKEFSNKMDPFIQGTSKMIN